MDKQEHVSRDHSDRFLLPGRSIFRFLPQFGQAGLNLLRGKTSERPEFGFLRLPEDVFAGFPAVDGVKIHAEQFSKAPLADPEFLTEFFNRRG